jgi:hypothetical protein
MGSSRDLMDELEEAMEDTNAVVDAAACRGTPYTNPKEWSWDAASNVWIHDDGTRMSHFTPTGQAAVVSGGKLMAPITPRPPYPHASIGATGAIGAPYRPIAPLVNFTITKPASSEMAVMTPHGKVKINLDTGVLTIPHGIGREEAIRDFWLGFQENFRGAERVKYETEIDSLKRDISHITQKAEEYKKEVNKIVKDTIVKKVSEKYGNEKFIMMKPADLIKFIEGT